MAIICYGTYGEPAFLVDENTNEFIYEGDVLESFSYKNKKETITIKGAQVDYISMVDVTLITSDGELTVLLEDVKHWEKG